MRIVPPPTDRANFNTLLYGPAKSGKTMGAASAPPPVLYLNADMPNSTRLAHRVYGDRIQEARFEDLGTTVDVVNTIEKQSPTYETVVLDTAGDAYRILYEGLSNRAVRTPLPAYADAGTYLERFCRRMCELPVNFVVVCHEMPVKDEASGVVEKLPYTGSASNPTLGGKLAAMVDIVGYAGMVEEEGTGPRYMAGLQNVNGRRGGDRFASLGKIREMDLSEWHRTIIAAEGPQKKEAQHGRV